VRPLSVKYYPIAIFFLLFDLETVLLFIWAAAAGEARIATLTLVSFLVFMGLLGLALAYLWRDGALEWR
jgi:NADH:ubiquinone oxidoreductase subunit 3 (chain A)